MSGILQSVKQVLEDQINNSFRQTKLNKIKIPKRESWVAIDPCFSALLRKFCKCIFEISSLFESILNHRNKLFVFFFFARSLRIILLLKSVIRSGMIFNQKSFLKIVLHAEIKCQRSSKAVYLHPSFKIPWLQWRVCLNEKIGWSVQSN